MTRVNSSVIAVRDAARAMATVWGYGFSSSDINEGVCVAGE